jgi:hypothetical protein
MEECFVVIGDNMSAISWLFWLGKIPMSSFYYKAVQFVAQKLVDRLTNSSHILSLQHLKGKKNVVADLLLYTGASWEEPHPLAPNIPSDRELTKRFHSFLPQLIPVGFAITLLPAKILLFAMQAMQIAESSWICAKSGPMQPISLLEPSSSP